MTSIRSRWAVTRPDINGEAQEPEEWDDAELLEFEHGKLYFKNDAENLYMLFDVLEDTIEDDIRAKEYLWIVVDADRSKNITPGTDLYFRFPGSGGRFEKAYWIEPTAPSHRWAWSDPVSEAAQTFDLSFNPSFPRHRICEVALNLEASSGSFGPADPLR
jgi:hypothetical protein